MEFSIMEWGGYENEGLYYSVSLERNRMSSMVKPIVMVKKVGIYMGVFCKFFLNFINDVIFLTFAIFVCY